MFHLVFHHPPQQYSYKIAVLIKASALNKEKLWQYYIEPLIAKGYQETDIIAFSLDYGGKAKVTVKQAKACLDSLAKATQQLGVKYLLVADAEYFKVLTGSKKAAPMFGYLAECTYKGFEGMSATITLNYQALYYDPTKISSITTAIDVLGSQRTGTYAEPGANIIKYEAYPDSLEDIRLALDSLHQYPILTCDIEAFSLEFHKAGIGSIAFAWNQHEGIAFSVGYNELAAPSTATGFFGYQCTNSRVNLLLKKFFLAYEGTLIYHNITYDAKILTYELFMENMLDTAGMIEGIKVMTKDVHCTKIITYLATNSCAGNVLGLKENSQEFTGNYAQEEIKDIRRIPKDQLLKYNLLDCLATWFVFNKNLPTMINDQQDRIYNTLMLPGIKVVMQEELCGMPIDMAQVLQVEQQLTQIQAKHLAVLSQSKEIQDYSLQLQKEEMVKKNLLLKVKVKPLEDFADIVFNPNSNPNLQGLLHDQWKLPVIDSTDSGAPATGGKTLNKHLVYLMSEFNISEEELNT